MDNSKNLKFLIISMLILIACLSFIPWGFNSYIKKKTTEQTKLTLKTITDVSNTSMKKHIETVFNALTLLSQNITKDMDSETDLYNNLDNYGSVCDIYHFKNIMISNIEGIAYTHTGEVMDVSNRVYFQKSIQGENYISTILSDKVDSNAINVFSVPIYYQNKVIGVLGVDYDSSVLYSLFRENIGENFGQTYLIDNNGYLITTQNSTSTKKELIFDNILPVKNPIPSNIKKLKKDLKNNVSSYIKCSFESKSYYIYYNPLHINNWWSISIIPEETVYAQTAPITKSLHLLFCIYIICTLAFVAFTIIRYKKNEQNLKSLAFFNPVTQIHNRAYMENFLQFLSPKTTYSFIVLDIKKFKTINELYGTKKGNSILKTIANLLQQETLSHEACAHSSGDEFLLLWKSIGLEERLQNLLNLIQQRTYHIDFSIGVYQLLDESLQFEYIYSYAHLARNESKEFQRTKITYYSNKLMSSILKEKELENRIEQGIKNKEFKAWIQPKFNKNGELTSGEALVRWYHEGKIIFPDQFIESSESNGMIEDIDKLVIEDVCQLLSSWRQANRKVCPISLNLSRVYLENGKILDYLKAMITKYNISPSLLQLEITESWFSTSEWKLEQTINALHKEGFTILLDDFGTGYSSLKTLGSSHFDILKIDKIFVDNLPQDISLIKYTVELAKSFSMDIIVEGVETKEQIDQLIKFDIDEFQGYYYSKPLTPTAFEKLLENS